MSLSFLPTNDPLSLIFVDDSWSLLNIAIFIKVFGINVGSMAIILISKILNCLTNK